LPVAVNSFGILFDQNIYFISANGGLGSVYMPHTCAIFVSPKSCFFIPQNDSKVCSGNGKN
jgi:hypothetical protein